MGLRPAAQQMNGPNGVLQTNEPNSPNSSKVKGQVHHCGVCGSTDHRLEQCTLPGAKRIRQLLQQLTSKKKSSRKGQGTCL